MKLWRFRLDESSEAGKGAAAVEQVARAAAAQSFWCRKFGDPELDEIVEEHRAWVESGGKAGKKAELAEANFEGADLMGAELRGANLLRANLRGADLLVADLRGACLIEADFSEANLVSTNFRGASLASASMATAAGLTARQLGGASLIGASLPETLFPFEGLEKSSRICKILGVLLYVLLAMCAGVCAVIAATTDSALIKNASAIPLLGHLMPLLEFYLAAPMALSALYIGFHFYLQELWDALEELPSVFPDGRRLSECIPGSMLALAPRTIAETELPHTPFTFFRVAIWKTLGYWTTPATLVLLWARYLVEQDWRGSLLQIFFVTAAAAMSGFLPREETSIFAGSAEPAFAPQSSWKSWRMSRFAVVTAAACVLLITLTLGAILGAPRELARAPELARSDFRRWPAYVFAAAGYDPYPNLARARMSDAPAVWSGEVSDLQAVKGARLKGASLRYARATRVFLANAQLFGADLTGGEFAEADFRGAILSSARLDRASLFRADFRAADLRYAFLENALAGEAKFDAANLYRANLRSAQMERATFSKSDLRGALLEDAQMPQANFGSAYLGEAMLNGAALAGANFGGAFLDDAKLQHADLRGATFAGAILNSADLTGAMLDGADFRGALGLTAAQICSAASRKNTQIEEALIREVNERCGGDEDPWKQ